MIEAEYFTPEDFQQRFVAAVEAARREYCAILGFWHRCKLKACRRPKTCRGDARLCLARGFPQITDDAAERAFAHVVAITAANADRPTQLARRTHPQTLYLWALSEQQKGNS